MTTLNLRFFGSGGGKIFGIVVIDGADDIDVELRRIASVIAFSC